MTQSYTETLKENFANMHTDMLLERKIKGNLTEEAEKLIDMELAKRELGEAEVESYAMDKGVQKLISKKLPNGIKLEDIANVWRRYVAQIVDQIIGIILLVITTTIAGLLVNDFFVFLIGITTYLAYITLNDSLPNGQSYGKYLLKIKVIDADTGEPCKIFQSLSRNITTIIPVVNLIDAIMIFNERNQRMGDKLANTLVVNA